MSKILFTLGFVTLYCIISYVVIVWTEASSVSKYLKDDDNDPYYY